MRSFVSRLGKYKYTIHNLIAHPLMEVLHIMGKTDLGDKIHDITLPYDHDNDDSQK